MACGRVVELFLGRLVAGHHGEIEAALHELQQAAGFGFDHVLLALHKELHGERPLVLHGVGNQALQLHALEAGGERGQSFGVTSEPAGRAWRATARG